MAAGVTKEAAAGIDKLHSKISQLAVARVFWRAPRLVARDSPQSMRYPIPRPVQQMTRFNRMG